MVQSLMPILFFQSLIISLYLLGLTAPASAQQVDSPTIEIATINDAMNTLAKGVFSEKKLAVDYLIQHGDPSLLPQLEELRSNVNRRVRRLMKPVIKLLRNKANLVSKDSEDRRVAARDLGASGMAEALPLLNNALSKEEDRWVKYDLEDCLLYTSPSPRAQRG